MLRGESRPLEQCTPRVLASLVVEALGRNRNKAHDVLESQEHLVEYERDRGRLDSGYELHPREWERARAHIAPPVISGNTTNGWQLTFCSVFGWMHEKQTLLRHRFRFTPDFRIEEENEILSRKIFKKTPDVIY